MPQPKEVIALKTLRDVIVATSAIPNPDPAAPDSGVAADAGNGTEPINLNPFAEAVGLTKEAEDWAPSKPVCDPAKALQLVGAIDKVIASGNLHVMRTVLKGVVGALGNVKNVIGAFGVV